MKWRKHSHYIWVADSPRGNYTISNPRKGRYCLSLSSFNINAATKTVALAKTLGDLIDEALDATEAAKPTWWEL